MDPDEGLRRFRVAQRSFAAEEVAIRTEGYATAASRRVTGLIQQSNAVHRGQRPEEDNVQIVHRFYHVPPPPLIEVRSSVVPRISDRALPIMSHHSVFNADDIHMGITNNSMSAEIGIHEGIAAKYKARPDPGVMQATVPTKYEPPPDAPQKPARAEAALEGEESLSNSRMLSQFSGLSADTTDTSASSDATQQVVPVVFPDPATMRSARSGFLNRIDEAAEQRSALADRPAVLMYRADGAVLPSPIQPQESPDGASGAALLQSGATGAMRQPVFSSPTDSSGVVSIGPKRFPGLEHSQDTTLGADSTGLSGMAAGIADAEAAAQERSEGAIASSIGQPSNAAAATPGEAAAQPAAPQTPVYQIRGSRALGDFPPNSVFRSGRVYPPGTTFKVREGRRYVVLPDGRELEDDISSSDVTGSRHGLFTPAGALARGATPESDTVSISRPRFPNLARASPTGDTTASPADSDTVSISRPRFPNLAPATGDTTESPPPRAGALQAPATQLFDRREPPAGGFPHGTVFHKTVAFPPGTSIKAVGMGIIHIKLPDGQEFDLADDLTTPLQDPVVTIDRIHRSIMRQVDADLARSPNPSARLDFRSPPPRRPGGGPAASDRGSGKPAKRGRFEKGSAEAKQFMAELRAKRKKS